MTVTFKCYGESDDLCEMDGDFYDEYTVSSYNKGSRYLRINRKGDKKDGFIIAYRYEMNGCWIVAPVMLEEDVSIPDWVSFRYGIEYDYSMVLECTLSGKKEEYEYAWLDNELREEME